MLNMRFRNTEKTTCRNETRDPCFNQIIGLHGHTSCRTLVCMFVGYTNRQMKRLLKQVPFVRHCFMCNEISGETRHVITGDGTLSLSLSLVLTLVMSMRYCSSSSWLSWQPASSCQTSALSGSGMPLRTSEGKPLGRVDRFPCLIQTQRHTFHYFGNLTSPSLPTSNMS